MKQISKPLKLKTSRFIFIVMIGLVTNCQNTSETIVEFGSGKDVIVSFKIDDCSGIEKIMFQNNEENRDFVSSEKLSNNSIIKYGFEGKGEGTFKVCIFTKSDTICSEHYVEGGYRPVLKYDNYTIEVVEHIGIGY